MIRTGQSNPRCGFCAVMAGAVVITMASWGVAAADDAPVSQAQAASPAAETCPKPILANPTWVLIPQVQQMDLIYPQRAKRLDQTDSVVVSCTVASNGALRNCRLVSDANPGFDFDKATLKVAPFYKTQPLSSNPAYAKLPVCARNAGPPTVMIKMDWTIEYGH